MNFSYLYNRNNGNRVNNALVMHIGDDVLLVSYKTVVARITNGVFERLWNGWSATTMKHINCFCDTYGIESGNKAWWNRLEVKEIGI